jgi:hypothetical protein
MKPEQIIKKVQEDASEWIEMCEEPATLVAGILATKLSNLMEYVDYLEKRIDYENRLRAYERNNAK